VKQDRSDLFSLKDKRIRKNEENTGNINHKRMFRIFCDT
jgi:hypothetical protein